MLKGIFFFTVLVFLITGFIMWSPLLPVKDRKKLIKLAGTICLVSFGVLVLAIVSVILF